MTLAYCLVSMRLVILGTVFALVGLAGASCSQMQSPTGATPAATGTANYASELAFCADQTNRYRASVGRPSLARSEALEDFAAQAAEHDALARVAHQHFVQTNGAGVALAETEILWWRSNAVNPVVEGGLAQMWRVGPGGEHYDIMSGNYTQIGCGVFVSNGEVTVAQDFRSGSRK